MGKQTLAEVETLAKKILKSYFCDSDLEFMISTFADDILWLGSGEKQKAEGREAVAAFFRAGKDEMIACDMTDEFYHTIDLGGGCYLCEGGSHLHNKPESEACLDLLQRVTFIFREKGDHLETVHIHNSVPYAPIGDDELFPLEAGRREFQALQAEFNQQAQFLERLYNTVPCGILQFSTDPGHHVVALNPMTWKFYGYASEEAYLNDIASPLQNVEPKDRDWILSVIDGLVLNGENAVYRRQCTRKNGEEAWINVVMGRIVNSNGEEVIQAVFTDITEQMRLEKAQEQERILENRSLRAAIYTAYPLIMSLNLTQDTYSCFADGQAAYNFPRDGRYSDFIQICLPNVYQSYQEDFEANLNRESILRRFADGEREIYMELQERGLDNKYHWIAVHVIYVENPFNSDVLAINLIKVLDTQRMEQARQEQLLRDALATAKAASRAKSDFLSRMSHDIRTPMNAIIGMATIGKLKIDDREAVLDCFQKIDASSQYLLSLINDILDMSRIETDKMEIAHEPFDFKDFTDEINLIISPQAADRGLSYEMRCADSLEKRYIGDALRTKQILLNLLSNSLKFTPAGGSIGVDIREEHRAGGIASLKFIVWDSGVGISEEFKEKLFQPFEQESPGNARNNVGSGLGLSIVYNLVQLMGGSIAVNSKKHEGATFTVVIPFQLGDEDAGPAPVSQEVSAQAQPTPVPQEVSAQPTPVSQKVSAQAQPTEALQDSSPTQAPLTGRRLLLVEDNALNQEIAQTLLEMNGAQVDVAENGLEAVECFAAHAPGTYQAILMDIRMPVMDGMEATRRIRAMSRPDAGTVPILAMTANAFEEDKKEAYKVQMNGYLVKPLDINGVLEELRRVMER